MPDPSNPKTMNLRGDQRYLFDMVMAIQNGIVPDKLAKKRGHKVHKARWLNTASTILRIYVSYSDPPQQLKQMVEYIMKVYAPFWFAVKLNPLAIHGSRYIFKFIKWTREMSKDVQDVARETLKQNGFFCHPENILLAMITDEDAAVREEGYKKIFEARNKPVGQIRSLRVPHIRYECDSYIDMIQWESLEITSPPCLHFHPNEYLAEYRDTDDIIPIPGVRYTIQLFSIWNL